MSATTKKSILLKTRSEAETSLTSARSLRDQWLAVSNGNPTNMTKKDVDHLGKALKNRLLTLKWDVEDLEELVGEEDYIDSKTDLSSHKSFIEQCKSEISTFINQLEEYETNNKLFNKHGITLSNQVQHQQQQLPETPKSLPPPPTKAESTLASAKTIITKPITQITTNPISQLRQYERLREPDLGEIHFDKDQIDASTNIFNNSLYDHYEANMNQNNLLKSSNATEVFNNLTRPASGDVYMNQNENEMILEMLETEYYNPPAGLLSKTRYEQAVRKIFDSDMNKLLSTLVLIFSFPIILIVFLVI